MDVGDVAVAPVCSSRQDQDDTGRLVVALALPEDYATAASIIEQRLADWQRAPPCAANLGIGEHAALTQPALLLVWGGARAQAEALGRLVLRLLGAQRRCFSDVEVLDEQALGEASRLLMQHAIAAGTIADDSSETPLAAVAHLTALTHGDNLRFAAMLVIARARSASLLWLTAVARPLRGRWLEALQCELSDLECSAQNRSQPIPSPPPGCRRRAHPRVRAAALLG